MIAFKQCSMYGDRLSENIKSTIHIATLQYSSSPYMVKSYHSESDWQALKAGVWLLKAKDKICRFFFFSGFSWTSPTFNFQLPVCTNIKSHFGVSRGISHSPQKFCKILQLQEKLLGVGLGVLGGTRKRPRHNCYGNYSLIRVIYPQAQWDTNWHCMVTHAWLCYRCLLSAGLVDK